MSSEKTEIFAGGFTRIPPNRKVFLSHSSKDKAFANMLGLKLVEKGIHVWIDEAELEIGDSLIQKIGEGIFECNFIAAVISSNSVKSNWVQKELQLAMTREVTSRSICVLPIVIELCKDEIPYFLRDKLYADFTKPGSFGVELDRLIRAISRHQDHKNQGNLVAPLQNVGNHDVGSVVHDRGNEFDANRKMESLRSFGFNLAYLAMALTIMVIIFASRSVNIWKLMAFFNIAIVIAGGVSVVASHLFRKAYYIEKNLIVEIEKIGDSKFYFTDKWWQQLRIGKHNKYYLWGMYLEVLSMSLMMLLCILGIYSILTF